RSCTRACGGWYSAPGTRAPAVPAVSPTCSTCRASITGSTCSVACSWRSAPGCSTSFSQRAAAEGQGRGAGCVPATLAACSSGGGLGMRAGLARLPFEQGEEALNAVDELHRLPAARVTTLGPIRPALLCEQRQAHAHVGPRIGVLALRLRDDARVLQMAEADVVGGDGEPGTVGLRDAVGDHLAHLLQIACAGKDALLGIVAVLDAHGLGGIGGQHHDATCAVLRLGARVPLRLLV